MIESQMPYPFKHRYPLDYAHMRLVREGRWASERVNWSSIVLVTVTVKSGFDVWSQELVDATLARFGRNARNGQHLAEAMLAQERHWEPLNARTSRAMQSIIFPDTIWEDAEGVLWIPELYHGIMQGWQQRYIPLDGNSCIGRPDFVIPLMHHWS